MLIPALTPSTIYFLSIIILLFILFVVIVFLIFFMFLEVSSTETEKSARKVKENAYNKAFSLIEDARNTSLKVMQDAQAKAQQILADSTSFSVASKNVLSKDLQDVASKQLSTFDTVSSQLLSEYKSALETQEKKNISTLEGMSTELKGELLHEVDEFKDILHRETIESQQMVDQKISSEFKKLEEEINAYKARQLHNIDDKVYKILAQISKDVFGKVLTIEDHQDIILKALEKAKEQGIFDVKL